MGRSLLVALFASLAVISAVFSALRLHAQATPLVPVLVAPQFVTFGMVGLAYNQTARLNALGLPMGGPIIAGASCQVTLGFVDAQGVVLKTSTLPVSGGASVHLDLQRGDIDANVDRKEIRGTVRTSITGPSASTTPWFAGCSVIPTLEVFDQQNGQTTAVLESTRSLPVVLPLAATQ